ncbi:MAG: pyridoxamine 5'-phosphate oxidase family protein [Corallincola sp.]|nr:pyridoxamine 5'-phosphate oxidase family protein [Corallincola sp.]
MNSDRISNRVGPEILALLEQQRSLMLASITRDGLPYASYAPFAAGGDCLYVLLSEIAVHANNLRLNPQASVLVIEDEASAAELFARQRVQYSVTAERLALETAEGQSGLALLVARHGERITQLSQLSDFHLFRLVPSAGRFVKGFGKAFAFTGRSLTGDNMEHLREGHRPRSGAAALQPAETEGA